MSLNYVKILTSCIAVTAIGAITSCDSSPSDDASNALTQPNAVAPSFDEPRNGDILTYVSDRPNVASFIPEIRLEGLNTTIQGSTYVYRKSGEFTFEIGIEFTGQDNLQRAIETLLGSTTPLGFRFREIILRDQPVFTAAEVVELVNLLNPAGADVAVDNLNPTKINSVSNRLYKQRVTSTNIDLQKGTMGGVYVVEENSFVLGYREPNNDELRQFRFLLKDHKIPFVTTKQNLKSTAESGIWTLDLTTRN